MSNYKWNAEKVISSLYDIFQSDGLGGLVRKGVDNNIVRSGKKHLGGYRQSVDAMFEKHGLGFTYDDVLEERNKERDREGFEWLYVRWKSGKPLDGAMVSKAEDNPYGRLKGRYAGRWKNVFDEFRNRYPDVTTTWEEITASSRERTYESRHGTKTPARKRTPVDVKRKRSASTQKDLTQKKAPASAKKRNKEYWIAEIDQNRELLDSYKENKNVEIRNAFMDRIMPFIEHHAKRIHRLRKTYSLPTLPVDALVKEGIFGAQRSMDKYDTRKDHGGKAFAGYFKRGITSAINRANDKLAHEIRIGSLVHNRSKDIKESLEEYTTIGGAADNLGMTFETVDGALLRQPSSINKKVGPGEDTEQSFFIEDESADDPFDMSRLGEVHDIIEELESEHPELAYIIEQHYIKERPMADIGRELGMDRKIIFYWRNKGLKKIREKLGIKIR